MAPNMKDVSSYAKDDETRDVTSTGVQIKQRPKWEIVWRNVGLLGYLHLGSVYGLYLCFTRVKIQTVFFVMFLHTIAGLCITAGTHRLWAHRTYKAKAPLRVLLMMLNNIAFVTDIYEWSRDHRVHHKFSETDADPHNAKRGFFFAHMGWLLVRKHPQVREQGAKVDMSDLAADPVVMFQRKYYIPLVFVMSFVMPTMVPNYFWGEQIYVAFYVCSIMRYTITLHSTWLVNSAAHLMGNKPYDKFIDPRQNTWVSYLAGGEGWHNYHHTFPYDYKASELGWSPNWTTMLIDLFASMGLAYDRKTVPIELVKRKMRKSGDGTHIAPQVTHEPEHDHHN